MKYQSAPCGCRRVIMNMPNPQPTPMQVVFCPDHKEGCPDELFADEAQVYFNPNDQPWDDGTYDDEFDDGRGNTDEEEKWEDAMQQCGGMPGGYCTNGGTEYCDFECPFRDEPINNESED